MKKNEKGFTLIEVIVVIAIIGIIGAITIPKFGNMQEKSRIKADLATADVIQKAVAMAIAEESIKGIGTITITVTGTEDATEATIAVGEGITMEEKALTDSLDLKDIVVQEKDKDQYLITISADSITVVSGKKSSAV